MSERVREELGVCVRKQLKTAAFGAAGALMRSRMNEDSSEETGDHLDFPTLGLLMAPFLLSSVSAVSSAAAVSLAWVLDVQPFKIPHFRHPNVQRDRAGDHFIISICLCFTCF